MSKVILIIPAYNESENILDVADEVSKLPYDYVFINDGSTDNSEHILTENKIPHISLVHNLGIGGAMQTGYKYAFMHGYDIAVQFDGDGQHNAADVERIIEPIINNESDMVIGSRFVDKERDGFKSSLARRLGIAILSQVLRMSSGYRYYDVTSGFRAVNRDIIGLFSEDYPQDYPEPESVATILRLGKRVIEIPVTMRDRLSGESSITALKSLFYMFKVTLAIMIQVNFKKRT